MLSGTIHSILKFPVFLILSAVNLSIFRYILSFVNDLANKKALTQYNGLIDPIRPSVRLLNVFLQDSFSKVDTVDMTDLLLGAVVIAFIWQSAYRKGSKGFPQPYAVQGGVKRPAATAPVAASGSSTAK